MGGVRVHVYKVASFPEAKNLSEIGRILWETTPPKILQEKYGELAGFLDRHLHPFLAFLEENKFEIALTSDHGEGLGEEYPTYPKLMSSQSAR